MKTVKPKKFLGQHFLKDLKIAQDIADTVDACPGIPVLEVGPGMGVMTQFLVRKDRPLKVVEIDFESVAYLRTHYPQLEENIIEDDFLKMHLERTFGGQPFVLTGNYPYNISSQIFFKMLDYKDLIPCCTGMIQKEVAERIAAGPGSKTYGILSVLLQAWYSVEYLFTVHEHVFNPPPKVKSAVIRMTRNATTDLGCDERLFKQVVKHSTNGAKCFATPSALCWPMPTTRHNRKDGCLKTTPNFSPPRFSAAVRSNYPWPNSSI